MNTNEQAQTPADWSSPIAYNHLHDASSSRPIACSRCRQRRLGCSKDRPQCSRCRESLSECVYEETRKIIIAENRLRELEAKAKSYDALMSGHVHSSTLDTTPASWISRNEDITEDEDDLPLLEPFTHLDLSQSYVGPGSSDSFLRSVRRLSGLRGGDEDLNISANLYDPAALRTRRSKPDAGRARLPPIDIARRLFAVQYTYIGTIFFFTDPETFEELLLKAYRGLPTSAETQARLTHAKVLMILAFGQMYSINQWIDFHGPPGFDYFTQALDLLPETYEEGSVLAVETLAYVGYFMQNMNRRDAAFLYIGMALRMAISLGLHQEAMRPDVDETSKEHRRRVWWSIYSLDRILTVKSGNPLTIQDEDIGVAMPSKLPTEPEYCPAVVLRHYTELSRILGEVTAYIYRKAPKSGSRLMTSVRNIMMSLGEWHRHLPADLRFDPARLSISRESVSTFLHYYQCINMTARPLLFHVVQRRLGNGADRQHDWKVDLSQTTIWVIEMCISAAKDTIHMMQVAAQLDLVATYGYMDGEHAFSAAIVLVMVCGAFPTDLDTTRAMQAGLDLLRGMAQRGNVHVGARYESLAHLKTIIMPELTGSRLSMAGCPTDQHGEPSSGSFLDASKTARRSGLGSNMASSQGVTMLGQIPNVGCAVSNVGGPFGMRASTEMLSTSLFNDEDFQDVFSGADSNSINFPGGENDFMLWEEGFADPVGQDLTQWMQATQTVMERGAV